jgi:hypothetical protein
MMKHVRRLAGVCLLVLAMASLAFAEEKKSKEGSLTGTWDCVAHLSGENDHPFTMKLAQKEANVTGSISTSDGELEIKSGTYKDSTSELHLEAPEAKYLVTGKLESGQFKGHWSKEPDGLEGDWEGKNSSPDKPSSQ